MEQFAILHETTQGQILVTKDYDFDDQNFKVVLRFDIDDNITCSPAIGFKSVEGANQAFEAFKDLDCAKRMANEATEGFFDEPVFS